MSSSGYRITIENIATGDTSTTVIVPGTYFLLTFEPCHVSRQNHYGNGVTQITIKGRTPEFEAHSPDGPAARVDGDASPSAAWERRRE